MKILLDMNLSPEWVPSLEQAGFVCVHWSAVGNPRATDADRPPEEDDTRGYVAEYYDQLRSFVMDAAVEGEAVLISMT